MNGINIFKIKVSAVNLTKHDTEGILEGTKKSGDAAGNVVKDLFKEIINSTKDVFGKDKK